MTYRTPQDIINRKEANQRYYKLEENKEQKRNYMKAYYKKNNWGGTRQENAEIKRLHEEWAKKNGYYNENLHATNTERLTNYEKRKN